jgi:hypothetical protein
MKKEPLPHLVTSARTIASRAILVLLHVTLSTFHKKVDVYRTVEWHMASSGRYDVRLCQESAAVDSQKLLDLTRILKLPLLIFLSKWLPTFLSVLLGVVKNSMSLYSDRLCGLVVRVPGYTEMYCFLWGTNWIYICYVEESRPPLWSSGQSSWLQMYCVSCEVRTEFIYVM